MHHILAPILDPYHELRQEEPGIKFNKSFKNCDDNKIMIQMIQKKMNG